MIDLIEKDLNGFGEQRISDDFPVAMAYVRWQKLERMYPPEEAFRRGTLFPELDKPFCGRSVMGGKK